MNRKLADGILDALCGCRLPFLLLFFGFAKTKTENVCLSIYIGLARVVVSLLWFALSSFLQHPKYHMQATTNDKNRIQNVFFRRYVKKQVSEFECSHKQKCVEQIKKKSQNANDRRPQQQQISKAQKFKKETKFKKNQTNEWRKKRLYDDDAYQANRKCVYVWESVWFVRMPYVCLFCVFRLVFPSYSFSVRLRFFSRRGGHRVYVIS